MKIAIEKSSGQIEVLMAKPLTIEGVIVEDPIANVSYVIISHVQPTIVQPFQKDESEEEVNLKKLQTITPPSSRRLVKLIEIK